MSGELTRSQRLALEDSHGCVKGYFIIVREPGRSPEKKRPPSQTSAGADRMLAELLNCRPDAELTLLRLTWDDDLWAEDGLAALGETAAISGLDLPNGGTAKLRHYERGVEAWVQAQGERQARKAAGPFRSSREALAAICGSIWNAALATPKGPQS